MNVGQTIFSQLSFSQLRDSVPTHEFNRCVRRYHGSHRVRRFAGSIESCRGRHPVVGLVKQSIDQRVLVAHSDRGVRASIAELAGSIGARPKAYKSGRDIPDYAAEDDIGCIVIGAGRANSSMPARLEDLPSRPGTPVIVVMEESDADLAVDLMRRGAFEVIESPVQPEILKEALAQAINEGVRRQRCRDACAAILERLREPSRTEREALRFVQRDLVRSVKAWQPAEPKRAVRPADPEPEYDLPKSADPLAVEAVDSLSPRLREVLDLLLLGEGEKQVAYRLGLSRHTVHGYIKILHRELNVSSRSELMALCLANGV